ncbi:MAG: tRNA (cytosine(32)/uridine(32)-2'-O)-methyltransferase TrmJ [Gammaproteobacteria bacterium]|nr:tRNA (cytosine(32)/uridine(32)-2'-O)-methyltransferase TrmJ [Gammaproteobacteria bacterium]
MSVEPQIHIVLVETSHPGNIGAVARAMKNMSLASLRLVQPRYFPHSEAFARASGAADVLDNAQVFDSLEAALHDCSLVMGTSARPRNLAWPMLDPEQCAQQAMVEAQQGGVALVFGRERTGLTNDELEHCHYRVHIPCNKDYSSLNIAAAVQVICYEVFKARMQGNVSSDEPVSIPVPAQRMEQYYVHLEQVLVELEFLNPQQPRHLMRRLRRLYQRARPDETEYNILRGILTAMQKKI